jgi:hypothetical protein
MGFLLNLKEEIKKDWSDTLFIGETSDETVQRNAFALGQIDILSRLMEASVEQVVEISDNAKS